MGIQSQDIEKQRQQQTGQRNGEEWTQPHDRPPPKPRDEPVPPPDTDPSRRRGSEGAEVNRNDEQAPSSA